MTETVQKTPPDGGNPPPAIIIDMAEAGPNEMIGRTAENDAIYRAIRGEIQFEITLVSARVNWLLVSQAFLFMPLTLSSNGRQLASSPFYPLIPVLGVVLCALVFVSILAAVWRSRQWRVKARQGAYTGDSGHDDFSIVLPHTPAIPNMGFAGAIGIPIILMATWIFVLFFPPAAG